MGRKTVVVLLVGLALASVRLVEAQQKVPRIGYVSGTGDPSNPGRNVEAFRQGLRDLGYVEGKNILIEYRYYERDRDRIPRLIAELVELKVEILVATSPPDIRAAKQATKTIPILIVTTQDPVATGIVDSLARPGGNITGLTTLSRDLTGKRLELLKELVPKLSRVGVLTVADPRVNALIMPSNIVLIPYTKKIMDFAIKNRMASMHETSDQVEAGGLMSYAANRVDQHRRAAVFVDKILKGTKPADLPVEQATKFEFVINLKTAKRIGLTIPPNVLVRADKVIK